MNPNKHEHFCHWLSGYFAALEGVDVARGDVKRIKEELAKVTDAAAPTPPSMFLSRPADPFAPPYNITCGGVAHAASSAELTSGTEQTVPREALDRACVVVEKKRQAGEPVL